MAKVIKVIKVIYINFQKMNFSIDTAFFQKYN